MTLDREPLAMRLPPLLLLLLCVQGLCAPAWGSSGSPRRAFYQVASPQDCRPMQSTSQTECSLKAATCFARYKVKMQFYSSPCTIGPIEYGVSGCQCYDRCRLFQQHKLAPGMACPGPATASPSAEPTSRPTPNTCFHADATVLLRHGASVPMRDLRVGDLVLSSIESGVRQYSPVVAFTTHRPDVQGDLLRIYFQGGHLALTSAHLVFASGDASEPRPAVALQARDVKPGMILWRAHGAQYEPAVVLQVRPDVAVGFYSPLTESGTLVVDGVLASSHSYSHALGQVLAWPVKLYLRYFPPALQSAQVAQREETYLRRVLVC
jgi:hypothetical protein